MDTPKFKLDISTQEYIPGTSPYNGKETSYSLYIDAENETIGIDEYDPGITAVSFREWHGFYMGVAIARMVDGIQSYPNARDLENCVHSDEGQALIQQICDGFSTHWDGYNNVGEYNDAARDAVAELEEMIADLDVEEYTTWSADDWLQNTNARDYGVDGTTSDSELEEIAQGIVSDAYADGGDYDHVVLDYSDILNVVTGWRDDLKANDE